MKKVENHWPRVTRAAKILISLSLFINAYFIRDQTKLQTHLVFVRFRACHATTHS